MPTDPHKPSGTDRPLCTVGASFLIAVTLSGCAELTEAATRLVTDPAFQPQVRHAINWVVENFGETILAQPIPLRNSPSEPSYGRWFLTAFQAREQSDQSLDVAISGFGYAGNPQARNVTFAASVGIRYWTDTVRDGEWILVRFRPISQPAVQFQPQRIDGFFASLFSGLVVETGEQLMQERLRRGFTVSWKSGGSVQMAEGVHQAVPRASSASGVSVPMSDRITLHEDGQDFLGPFLVRAGETVELSVATDAAWGMDAWLLDHSTALQALYRYYDPATYPAATLYPLLSNEGRPAWRSMFRPTMDSQVWLVLDNTDAGQAMPASNMENDVLVAQFAIRKLSR